MLRIRLLSIVTKPHVEPEAVNINYAVLIQDEQTALNLLNNKRTINEQYCHCRSNPTHARKQKKPNYHNMTLLYK